MTIRTNPNASSHRRGLIRVQISGSALRSGGLFFLGSDVPSPLSERVRVLRSARSDMPAPALDRKLTLKKPLDYTLARRAVINERTHSST